MASFPVVDSVWKSSYYRRLVWRFWESVGLIAYSPEVELAVNAVMHGSGNPC